MENKVEIIEIWQECEPKDSEAILWQGNKALKMVAMLANGHPLKSIEGFVMERRHVDKYIVDKWGN